MFPLYDENRSRILPFVTWIIIAVNGLVFWWEFEQGILQEIFLNHGVIPILLLRGERLFSLITSMFLHADFWHILGNMVYLFIFGDNVEDKFGHVKHLLLYFVFGIAGVLAHSIVAVIYGGPEAFFPAIGASGAISGILGAYIVFFPKARIISIVPSFLFVRLARVPAVIFIGFWFLLQILYSGGSSSVAYMAHIGGFMTGFIVALLFKFKKRKLLY